MRQSELSTWCTSPMRHSAAAARRCRPAHPRLRQRAQSAPQFRTTVLPNPAARSPYASELAGQQWAIPRRSGLPRSDSDQRPGSYLSPGAGDPRLA
eukprot:3295165-Prymnesium_polylepis.1